MSGRRRANRSRRTWPQRLVISFNVVAIVAALATAGSVAYAKHKLSQISRVDLSAANFRGTKGLTSTDPRNFLIVGADSDVGLGPNDPAVQGRQNVGGVRSDTIMVVRIDPKTTQAKILSFPRDLWVDIPGQSKNRINAALQFGGPDLLIQTIKQDFGIDINHYVQVDFAGFKSLVAVLGGIPIYFATPVADGSSEGSSGLHIDYPGCTMLDPTGALAYVRSRHLYRIINGHRVYDGTSDLGRISRQQDFIKRVLQRAIAQGARNPFKLVSMVDIGVRNIALDRETTAQDLIDLGTTFRNFDPATLQSYSLPVTDANHGGAAVLDLQVGPAEPTLALFRGTGAATNSGLVVPNAVAVKVLNGTGKSNQAASTTDALRADGFQTESPDQTLAVARTEVHYMPGMEAQAVLVAQYLYADPILVADPDAATIIVKTGPDFGAVLTTPRPVSQISVPATTTTSTAPTTTSTVVAATTAPTAGGTVTSTTNLGPAVTTTTVAGYVPGPPPAGVACG